MTSDYDELRKKVDDLQEYAAAEIVSSRKRNGASFSDEQSRQLDERFAKTLLAFLGSDTFSARINKEVKAAFDGQALRFFVSVAISFVAGASLAYLKLKT